MTLSPPIRIFAFVGALVALGLAAFVFLVPRGESDAGTTSPTSRVTQSATEQPTPAARKTTKPPVAILPASGFPIPVHRALRRNRVVVVVVYMPGGTVDPYVRAEAKAGARAAKAGVVQISALSERLVQPLVAKTGVLPSPAVLVLTRPGVVSATLSVADRGTIVQAVAQARR